MSAMVQNQHAYALPEVAALYAAQSHLQPAEEAILRLLLPRVAGARMLDLGVGGGRTTLHFAQYVKEYVGADYSDTMIAACRRRFSGYPSHIRFAVCDARDLGGFPAGSFDFVLFSFNGLDCVAQEDRLKILKEIRRVGRPGAWFCFSSHNLNWCSRLSDWRRLIRLDPRQAVPAAKRMVLRFVFNWNVSARALRQAPYLIFHDHVFGRRIPMYYIRPAAQIAQLQSDFTRIRVFVPETGAEVADPCEQERLEARWLYYLCEMK